MTRVFYLDMYDEANLITAADPEPQRWNGWAVPNPTPREMVKFLDELRPLMGEDEWWDTLSAFMAAYGNDRHDDRYYRMDEPILGYMGFTWQERQMFDLSRDGLSRALASGHVKRKGHELVGYYRPTDNDTVSTEVVTLVRLCCKEPEPPNGSSIVLSPEEWDNLMKSLEDESAAPSALIELLRKKGASNG